MKRILIVVFCLWALIALTGCQKEAKSTSIPKSTPVPTYLPETQDKTTTPSEKTEESASSIDNTKPTPSPCVTVDWQTISYRWEDNSGYKFEATIKISPWINTKNTDYVTAAWNEVGSGKTLPSDDSKSWGNAPSSDDYYRPVDNATDVYYCIGNVTIKNLTTGWDITASAPVKSNPLWFSACQPETNPAYYKQHPNTFDYLKSSTISKIYYGNGEERNSTWACLTPQYTSNKWGPVPFIFAHFDSKAPANPDGKYISEIADTYFCVNTNNNWIWDKEMSELSTLKLSIVE